MKQLIIAYSIMFSAFMATAQTKEQTRAKEGQMVWVIINHIKDEAKADYLTWMNTYFLPAVSQSKEITIQKQYNATRWLEPQKQNADKTWTYSFIMDPVVPNGNYDIEVLLKNTYGEEKGTALNKAYMGYLAQPILSYVLVQSKI